MAALKLSRGIEMQSDQTQKVEYYPGGSRLMSTHCCASARDVLQQEWMNYLSKPFTGEQLEAIVRKAIDSAAARSRAALGAA
jgi:DNA-binding NtrC family response regulator